MQCVTYLRAGAFLHVNTVLYLALMKPCFDLGLARFEQSLFLPGIAWSWLLSFLLANAVLSQLDARSRWQNYKQVKDQLCGFGYRERIFKPVLNSSCQRHAVLIAAEACGYRPQAQALFRAQGYRWYHILPDFVFSHPQFLLSRHFWRTTFFAPTYHPRHSARKRSGHPKQGTAQRHVVAGAKSAQR
jgi:hypothetical protein